MSYPREIVVGRYVNPKTYVLYKEDGTEFMTIREGRGFRIGHQIRAWIPTRVKKKNGKGTILICKKYSGEGDLMDEFPLIHNKKGLWAKTSRAARKGVFRNYVEPNTETEKVLTIFGINPKVIKKIEKIDFVLESGGATCYHVGKVHGYEIYTDGTEERLTEPQYAPDDHPNQFHRGCIISTYKTRIQGGTFLIYVEIKRKSTGRNNRYIKKIWLTSEANDKEVAKNLARISPVVN
ncbi:MAG: hypothetical protein IKG56_04565 [Clostridia bacterium]|nr:hypothetical protein [Clostridia bacterium]